MNPTNEPTTETYHAQSSLSRCLTVASAAKKLKASLLQMPQFYPTERPTGRIALYFMLLLTELASAVALGFFMSLAGAVLMGLLLPLVVTLVEFVGIPLLKYTVMRDKRVSALRAFMSEGAFARDAFSHDAHAWVIQDWASLLILTICLISKCVMLMNYGAFFPEALLLGNYIVAVVGFGFHLGGLPSQVQYYLLARHYDRREHSRRLKEGHRRAVADGRTELGGLAPHLFFFSSPVKLRPVSIPDHELIHKEGEEYSIASLGLLDDSDRAALLVRQPNAAQVPFAKVLAHLQLEQLQMPEMLKVKEGTEAPPLPESSANVVKMAA